MIPNGLTKYQKLQNVYTVYSLLQGLQQTNRCSKMFTVYLYSVRATGYGDSYMVYIVECGTLQQPITATIAVTFARLTLFQR